MKKSIVFEVESRNTRCQTGVMGKSRASPLAGQIFVIGNIFHELRLKGGDVEDIGGTPLTKRLILSLATTSGQGELRQKLASRSGC